MLSGKTCVVTGAGSGMGRAAAIEMSRQGAELVFVTDVNGDNGRATVSEIEANGGKAVYRQCDVSDAADVQALFSFIDEEAGVLDVLHNNAGVVDAQIGGTHPLYEVEEHVWDRVFDVNVKGSWLCIKHAKDLLARSQDGVIVNCASVASFLHFEGETVYVASKSAILGLTRTAAVELAPFGIRCVAYAPATIDTPMNAAILEAAEDRDALVEEITASHLIPRLGQADDIAKLVCFLASDDASFMTGSCHVIDGGALAWRGLRETGSGHDEENA